MIDFEMKKPIIYTLDELPVSIKYNLNGVSNHKREEVEESEFKFDPKPMSKEDYTNAYHIVQDHLQYGNTFLLNLAFPTEVETDLSLSEIYARSEAKYKLHVEDELVVFSPETFIKIKDNHIYSYPMKGTIDADAMGADLYILNDKKETAEHCTIVDLIRNDLSMVAKEVRVTKFRYIDTIKTNVKKLHQVSSEIRGKLTDDYHSRLGDILFTLLPAGSVSGAPKPKTLEIIKEAELQDRGYYTGVFGVYDGKSLDSGVMIRFIEKTEEGKLQYRSGGGITAMSDLDSEYQELIDKIYVPTHRKHQDFQWPYLQSTFLLDTNIVLYLLSGDKTIADIINGKQLYISFITELELLGYPELSQSEKKQIQTFIDECSIINITEKIKERTIEIRQSYKTKLPDSIIAATSDYLSVPLLTSDTGFRKIQNVNTIIYEL